MFNWMKNPMAGANSLQEYEVSVDRLIGNLIIAFSLLLTALELLPETSIATGLFAARYAILTGFLTFLIKKVSLPPAYKGVILVSVPTLLVTVLAVTDPYFFFIHHIFFILIIAISMYFHAHMLLAYGILLNISLLVIYFIQPTGLFGDNEKPGDVYVIFALINGVIFVLYHGTKWMRTLLSEVLHNSGRQMDMEYNDLLTGVSTRTSLLERLTNDIQWADTNSTMIAVAAMDIDNFKEINDTFGHSAGDQFLVKVADRICACTRSTDTVARMDGDEFCVVLTGIRDTSDAVIHMNRIIDSLASPHMYKNNKLKINVSIGLAFYPQDGSDPQALLNTSNEAMYSAKCNGKNCLRIFEDLANA